MYRISISLSDTSVETFYAFYSFGNVLAFLLELYHKISHIINIFTSPAYGVSLPLSKGI